VFMVNALVFRLFSGGTDSSLSLSSSSLGGKLSTSSHVGFSYPTHFIWRWCRPQYTRRPIFFSISNSLSSSSSAGSSLLDRVRRRLRHVPIVFVFGRWVGFDDTNFDSGSRMMLTPSAWHRLTNSLIWHDRHLWWIPMNRRCCEVTST